jgi:hypothetical protein
VRGGEGGGWGGGDGAATKAGGGFAAASLAVVVAVWAGAVVVVMVVVGVDWAPAWGGYRAGCGAGAGVDAVGRCSAWPEGLGRRQGSWVVARYGPWAGR